MEDGRFAWALLLACPTCAGGFLLAVPAAAFGLTAAMMRSALLAVAAGLIGALWLRNAWRRRAEGCVVDAA